MEPVDRRGRRTPDATVLPLVPHATSRGLLLLLQHCDIDGGGDGSVSRGRGDGRVTSGLREKERRKHNAAGAGRLVTCLSDGDDPGRDGMRVQFIFVLCVWAGRICQMSPASSPA